MRIWRDCGMSLALKPNSTRIDETLRPTPRPFSQSVVDPLSGPEIRPESKKPNTASMSPFAAAATKKPDAVLGVEQRHAGAAGLLERVAVNRPDASQRELPFERQVSIRQAEERARREQLAIREGQVTAQIEDMALVACVAADTVSGELRGPLEPQPRLLPEAEIRTGCHAGGAHTSDSGPRRSWAGCRTCKPMIQALTC